MIRSITFALAIAATVGLIGSEALAQGSPGIRTPQAIKIFDEVCGRTLPSFQDAESRAKALGFAFQEDNKNKDIRISAYSNSNGRSGCSIQYGTVETIVNLRKGLRLLGDIRQTGTLTAEVPYRDSPYVAEIRVDELRRSGRIVVNLQIEID